MTLDILRKEMVAAMKNGQSERKEVLTSAIGACKYAAIADGVDRENPPEELVNRVLLKEIKTRQEMIDTCPVDREDLLFAYKYRINILKEYAPKQFTEEELRIEVRKLLAELPEGLYTKGMVMKELMPKLKGKADGKLINKIICEEAKV